MNSCFFQIEPCAQINISQCLFCRCRPLNRKAVGVFLGNDSAAERINVPYGRVVHSPGSVSGDDTFIETALVSGY